MKNKKLFAILTLVCFMFTLMPVAAFAAPTNDMSKPYVAMDAKYASVEVGDVVNFKIVEPQTFNVSTVYYVYAVKDGALSSKLTTTDSGVEFVTLTTTGSDYGLNIVKAVSTTDSEIKATVGLKFTDMGEYQIYVAKAVPALVEFIDGENLLKADVLGTLNKFAIGSPLSVKVGAADSEYSLKVEKLNPITLAATATLTTGSGLTALPADNGFNSVLVDVTLMANLSDSDYVVVPGQTVKAFADSHAVKVTPVEAATGVDGAQMFSISASIPGNYNVYVSYGDVTTYFPVNVTPVGATEVSVLKAPTATKNVDTTDSADSGIVFQLTDANGFVMKGNDGDRLSDVGITSGDAKVTLVSAPVKFDKTAGGAYWTLEWSDETAAKVPGWVVVNGAGTAIDLNKEGTYTFKVALQNGSSATASVTVDEFGKAVKAEFADVPETVVVGTTYNLVTASQLVLVDEKGVTMAVEDSTYVYTVSASGAAVSTFTTTGNGFNLAVGVGNPNAEKFIGTTVNMFAVVGTGTNAMTATAEMTVTAPGAVVDIIDTEVAVGKTVVVTGEIKDTVGNNISTAIKEVKVIVLDKPATAVANASVIGTYPATDDEVSFNFIASEAGEYKVQVVVITSADKYVTGIETITVGGAHGAFNDVIVMSIGATTMVKNSATVAMPAAPEIKDSRTMVPARAGLEAFGAVVAWDEATQTVTAELNGVKVVMTIGEKAYTVNGKVVVGDAAPYITAASTMVPVSFFTNAFGITATPIYDANGVCDVLFTK